jgi:hypothetical protein
MTLAELKTAVRAQFDNGNHETANQWVKESFGDLRKRETWQDAYDRCQEFIAAKADEALEATKEATDEIIEMAAVLVEHGAIAAQEVISETLTYDNVVNAAFSATTMAQKALWRVLEYTVIAVMFCYFLAIEWREAGAIDRLQRDMTEYQQRQELQELFGLQIDPMMLHRRYDLAIASSLPLRGGDTGFLAV